MRQLYLPISLLVLCLCPSAQAAAAFVHPGILHTNADLDRIRTNVANGIEPWKSAFVAFAAHPESSAAYRVRGGFEVVSRDARAMLHHDELWHDANAAYQNALVFAITGDTTHAKKSA